MKKKKNNNFFQIVLVLLCTSLIILTNDISSKKIVKNIHKEIMQTEYNKIWWKTNYEILKELQKQEILTYLETIKKEKPELIKEVENKINASNNNLLYLNKQNIINLKKDTYIKWNTWALVSIIEFSDLECTHCIDYHKSNIIWEIIESNPNKINYLYKNFPLPTNKNSYLEAKSSICVKNLSNNESYFKYIDKIYNTTKWWWEWLDLSNLWQIAEELWIKKDKFQECLKNNTYSEYVKNDFEQWIKLWINSVPSTIILNNETWEYLLIKEKAKKEEIIDIISKFIS